MSDPKPVRLTPAQKRANIVDIIVVFLLMAFGVAISDQVLGAAKQEGAFSFSPVGWSQFIGGLILAGIFIGGTDLLQGQWDGKMNMRARVRRYSSALQSGVTFRLLAEAV